MKRIACIAIVFHVLGFGLFSPSGAEETQTIKPNAPVSLIDIAEVTVKNSPLIMIQELGVEAARAGAQLQTGLFDVNTSVSAGTGRTQTPIFPAKGASVFMMDDESQNMTLGLSKQFRTGIATRFNVSVIRANNMTEGGAVDNSGAVNLMLSIPFLKGAGRVSAAADETAANLDAEAALSDLYYFISTAVLSSINAYWSYLNAIENLRVHQESLERMMAWKEKAKDMIQKSGQDYERIKKQYEHDVSRLKGYLSDKSHSVITAEAQINKARNDLAITAGIPSDQADSIGVPSASFPSDWKTAAESFDVNKAMKVWGEVAKQNRLDLKASERRLEGAKVRLAKTQQDLKPSLNLNLGTGINGADQGPDYGRTLASLGRNNGDMNHSVSLDYSYPLGNNVAKAMNSMQYVAYQQSLIAKNDLERSIVVSLNSDVVDVKQRLQEVKEAQNMVASFKESFETLSRNMDTLGDPSLLFSMIDLDEKLTAAQIKQLASLNALAQSIAKVRVQTGNLIVPDSNKSGKATLGELDSLPGF